MENRRFDVVGLGYCAVDYIGMVPEYPALDDKMQLTEFTRQGGGPTANAMATVARLGGRASFIGKVGDDDFGRFIVEQLGAYGVDTGPVVVEPGASSQFSFVVVDRDTAKRTIFWTPSGMRLGADEIRREDVVAGRVLHIDNHHAQAALRAATWAHDSGMTVLMDAGTLREGTEELLEHTDVLIASTKFARQYTGTEDPERAAQLMFAGRRLSAVTLGDKGCYWVTSEGMRYQPAFAVKAVDTTGAGDVFHGAFSFGLSQGWDFARTMGFASAVAALKCTRFGGRAGIPTMAETMAFLDAAEG